MPSCTRVTNKNTARGCSNWQTNQPLNSVNNFYEKEVYKSENNSVISCLTSRPLDDLAPHLRRDGHAFSRVRRSAVLRAGVVKTISPGGPPVPLLRASLLS